MHSLEWMLHSLTVLFEAEDMTVYFYMLQISVPGDDRKISTHPVFTEQLLH